MKQLANFSGPHSAKILEHAKPAVTSISLMHDIKPDQTKSFFFLTRSCAALRAADLDWIVGPEYSLGGYITLDGGGGAGQE